MYPSFKGPNYDLCPKPISMCFLTISSTLLPKISNNNAMIYFAFGLKNTSNCSKILKKEKHAIPATLLKESLVLAQRFYIEQCK